MSFSKEIVPKLIFKLPYFQIFTLFFYFSKIAKAFTPLNELFLHPVAGKLFLLATYLILKKSIVFFTIDNQSEKESSQKLC